MPVLHRDIETRGALDLRKVGAHRYAADQATEVLCVCYAVDGDPVKTWLPSDPVPPEFIEAARDPGWIVVAHNDQFETAIERHVLAPRHGFPLIPLNQHHCTMAAALALGLPGQLARLADALELANRKDKGRAPNASTRKAAPPAQRRRPERHLLLR
jgi:DNA polymerase